MGCVDNTIIFCIAKAYISSPSPRALILFQAGNSLTTIWKNKFNFFSLISRKFLVITVVRLCMLHPWYHLISSSAFGLSRRCLCWISAFECLLESDTIITVRVFIIWFAFYLVQSSHSRICNAISIKIYNTLKISIRKRRIKVRASEKWISIFILAYFKTFAYYTHNKAGYSNFTSETNYEYIASAHLILFYGTLHANRLPK